MSSPRSIDLSGGPFDCAIVRALDFVPQPVTNLSCCPNIDQADVQCEEGRIVSITIDGQDARGPMTESIGDLTSLRIFTASGQHLSGTLPTALKSLTKLEQLNLSSNSLRGPVPDGLGNLSSLKIMDLRNNNLSTTAPIPLLPRLATQSCHIFSQPPPPDPSTPACLLGPPAQHIGGCYDHVRAWDPLIQPCPQPTQSAATSTRTSAIVWVSSFSITIACAVMIALAVWYHRQKQHVADQESSVLDSHQRKRRVDLQGVEGRKGGTLMRAFHKFVAPAARSKKPVAAPFDVNDEELILPTGPILVAVGGDEELILPTSPTLTPPAGSDDDEELILPPPRPASPDDELFLPPKLRV